MMLCRSFVSVLKISLPVRAGNAVGIAVLHLSMLHIGCTFVYRF